ncbi:MAG: phosphoribosyltransferase family protein [Bacteroidetes bacterium]|jgi:ComF family protein|nr:phosphoribosyltransferase family protein [Bacteroidota bacterium]
MRYTEVFHSILSLLYPEVCAACGTGLMRNEKTVCLSCRHLLPKTGYEEQLDNPLARIFWGRIHFEAVAATFFFSKQGKIQHLVHELKYKRNRHAGIFLGEQTGECFQNEPLFQQIDYLVPVPLHPKRQHQRGYNQSEVIAQGISNTFPVPIAADVLYRAVATTTQTRKSRQARWENVKHIFAIKNEEKLIGKHILLLDDVITTGSTLEACGQVLKQIPDIKVSVATAACAVS